MITTLSPSCFSRLTLAQYTAVTTYFKFSVKYFNGNSMREGLLNLKLTLSLVK